MTGAPTRATDQVDLPVAVRLKLGDPSLDLVEGDVDRSWDMALVEELTRLYEADLALIAAMEGVEFSSA